MLKMFLFFERGPRGFKKFKPEIVQLTLFIISVNQ